jgi:uncharacterized repeat protein (TIGR04052 family)
MPHRCYLFPLGVATFLSACAAPAAVAPAGVPVTLRFAAQAGDEVLKTSATEPAANQPVYQGLGQDAKPVRPLDFRFYIHDVKFLNAEGQATPVTLQANTWQYRNLALVDLDQATTPEFNDMVRGSVAPGAYTGVQFTLGVPADLNHLDKVQGEGPNAAPHAILAWDNHATGMGWSWMAGRKYAKIDFAIPQGDGTEKMYSFHLGGLGASNPTKAEGPSHEGFEPARTQLKEPNLATITLSGVNPLDAEGVIVADLKLFLANVEIGNGGNWFGDRQAAAVAAVKSVDDRDHDHGADSHAHGRHLLGTADALSMNLGLYGGTQRMFRWQR